MSEEAIDESPEVARQALIAAAQARSAQAVVNPNEAQFAAERDERQKFRRLVSVGIQRNNDARTALDTIRTLLKLAENIQNNPDEPKYRQFKTTNAAAKRTLIDPKGSLEYAVALGFRAAVVNYQPLYVFTPTPKNLTSLRIGASALQEVLEREEVSEERIKAARDAEKAARARQLETIKLAYQDDRKEKEKRDLMEKERREALAQIPKPEASESSASDGIPVYGSRPRGGGGEMHILPVAGGARLDGGPVIDLDDDDQEHPGSDDDARMQEDDDDDEDDELDDIRAPFIPGKGNRLGD